jgi:hypothetical protein
MNADQKMVAAMRREQPAGNGDADGRCWPEADGLVCGNQRQETDIRRSRRPAAQDALILVKSGIKNKIDVGDRLANGGSYGPRQPLSLSP